MKKWEPLNMSLRSKVIGQVIRLEQMSSSVLKVIFRMAKNDSKTLNNGSSSLTFKTKIDVLLDLEEINNEEYKNLIKLMEIRNQFAHNPYASSFESLDQFLPGIKNYLLKSYSSEINSDSETELKKSFEKIYEISLLKLYTIELEYTKGIEIDINRHINNLLYENLDILWERAKSEYLEKKIEFPKYPKFNNDITTLNTFQLAFKEKISDFRINKLSITGEDYFKNVFSRKKLLSDLIKDIKERTSQG